MTTSEPLVPGSVPSTLARPSEVRTSFRLWLLQRVVSLAQYVAVWVWADAFERSTRAAGGVPVVSGASIGLDLARWAVGTCVAVGFALVMRRGRNWARIVLTVLGGLGVLVDIGGLIVLAILPKNSDITLTVGGPIGVVLVVAEAAVLVAAIVMFYRPAANAYFSAARR